MFNLKNIIFLTFSIVFSSGILANDAEDGDAAIDRKDYATALIKYKRAAEKNNVNAESFSNYYEARGWKLKGIQMKDWKACVRTWEGNDYKPKQNNFTNNDRPSFLDTYQHILNK